MYFNQKPSAYDFPIGALVSYKDKHQMQTAYRVVVATGNELHNTHKLKSISRYEYLYAVGHLFTKKNIHYIVTDHNEYNCWKVLTHNEFIQEKAIKRFQRYVMKRLQNIQRKQHKQYNNVLKELLSRNVKTNKSFIVKKNSIDIQDEIDNYNIVIEPHSKDIYDYVYWRDICGANTKKGKPCYGWRNKCRHHKTPGSALSSILINSIIKC